MNKPDLISIINDVNSAQKLKMTRVLEQTIPGSKTIALHISPLKMLTGIIHQIQDAEALLCS